MGSIQLEQVRKEFGPVSIIKGVDLDIKNGEFVVFVGPSGCGKSTLLRLISGLEDITSGKIIIDGKDATDLGPAQRGLAMVFQSYALYPHMTVRNNIAFPLKMAKASQDVIDQKVARRGEDAEPRPTISTAGRGQLSGGQRQRVAIGRAIVREPKAFLFDEPLSNLDAALRVQMRVEIGELHNTLKTTMVYVTHDQVEAMTMADKIVVLDLGTISQVGSPLDLYNKPDNLFVAKFIGSPTMNTVTGASAAKRGADTIGIRPEHIDISTTEGEWPGKVRLAEHLGSETFVYVDVDGVGQIHHSRRRRGAVAQPATACFSRRASRGCTGSTPLGSASPPDRLQRTKSMSVKLSAATLGSLPTSVAAPKYARAELKPGIFHIGVGNFHRAHQAVYLDDLFNLGASRDWALDRHGRAPGRRRDASCAAGAGLVHDRRRAGGAC